MAARSTSSQPLPWDRTVPCVGVINRLRIQNSVYSAPTSDDCTLKTGSPPINPCLLALFWAPGRACYHRCYGAWQLRRPITRQIIVLRVTTTLAFAANLLLPP